MQDWWISDTTQVANMLYTPRKSQPRGTQQLQEPAHRRVEHTDERDAARCLAHGRSGHRLAGYCDTCTFGTCGKPRWIGRSKWPSLPLIVGAADTVLPGVLQIDM